MTFKELRLYRSFSYVKLAIFIGVNPTSIRQWEKGVCRPSENYLVKLAQLFRISEDEMRKVFEKKGKVG